MSEREFELIECDDAAGFLSALRRSGPRWLEPGAWEMPWVFRGQRCSCWEPTPASWRSDFSKSPEFIQILQALRPEEYERWLGDPSRHPDEVAERRRRVQFVVAQRKREDQAVEAFVNIAHRVGLRVPGGEFEPRVDLLPESREARLPAFAMAQHHGMPTDLLDFTYNTLYAAFFAAEEFKACKECDRLAVWALDVTCLSNQWRVLRIPPPEIDFLRAQSGLFVYCPGAFRFYLNNGRWPELEQGVITEDGLRKLTLPKRHRRELVRLLWAEGVSRAHLMPTHDNVTKALEQVWKVIATDADACPAPSDTAPEA